MIKKFVPYILIAVILVQLFAPFTVGMGRNNNLEVKANKVEASWDTEWNTLEGFQNAFKNASKPSSIKSDGSHNMLESNPSVDLTIKLDTGLKEDNPTGDLGQWMRIEPTGYVGVIGIGNQLNKFASKDAVILVFQDNQSKDSVGYVDLTTEFLGSPYSNMRQDPHMPVDIEISKSFGVDPLTKIGASGMTSFAFAGGVNYTATLYYWATQGDLLLIGRTAAYNKGLDVLENGKNVYFPVASVTFTTPTKDQQFIGVVGSGETKTTPGEIEMPECRIDFYNTIGGCLGQLLYKLVFRPSSALFAITGKLLDVSISYSIKDTSYRSAFVVEGWGLVRDLCNMFFIFILLYIAFSTILNLSSVNTKQMIINVVIIGLLINFSLFATQVIIDASNVLTRVFYNESALVIGEKGLNDKVVTSQTGKFGEIKLSEAIVTKIGPQKLIQGAAKVGTYTNASGDEITSGGVTAGTFILMVILASAVNIVGLIVFLATSLIFITRVIGLWIAMILAPVAFFSYTIPAMQGWETIGWKKWWPETIKMAFLAPVFLFFMYLIVKFLGIMPTAIFDADSKSGMDFVVAIMIPFALVMVLMWKAKEIATKMSGTIGESVTKFMGSVGPMGAAKFAAGMAGGVMAGGAAVIARRTVGKGALNTLEGEKGAQLREKATQKGFGGFMARQQLKGLEGASKASFDARKTKAGSAFSKATGINLEASKAVGLGSKEGGWEKTKEDVATKRQKRADQLKVGKNETLSKTLRQNQEDLTAIKTLTNAELTKVQKGLEAARKKLSDENKGSDGSVVALAKIAAAKRDVDAYVDEEKDIKEATGAHRGLRVNGKNLKKADEEVIKSENAIASENAERLNAEADRLRGKGGSINEEAAYRIRSGAQAEENKKK